MKTTNKPTLDNILHDVGEAAIQAIRDYRDHKEPKSRELTKLEAKDQIKTLLLNMVEDVFSGDGGTTQAEVKLRQKIGEL